MESKKDPITLPKNVRRNDGTDFNFLRERGIAYIESLSSKLWTDYNTHDPGITILETLCYAITDLEYRLSLPMEQLLAGEQKQGWEQQFHLAENILPAKAITELDYRKLFIDCRGVRNAWINPFQKQVFVDCKNSRMSYDAAIWEGLEPKDQKSFELKGLYRIMLDLDGSVPLAQVTREVAQRYHQNRNICEDLVEVVEVGRHPIRVCALIEIQPTADEELIHAQIETVIARYFSPPVNSYTLAEMLEKGYSVDQLFEGPLLRYGFLDPVEVVEARLRTEVRLSDIIRRIMDVPGVKLVKDIQLGDCDLANDEGRWVVPVRSGCKPYLCDRSKFNFSKGLLPLNVDADKVNSYRTQIEQAFLARRFGNPTDSFSLPVSIPSAVNSYYSVRNDFPENYGIGKIGLPETASPLRKSQAKQLKGYLQFFDQIMASYFSHLSQVRDLLSIDGARDKTYFTQAVLDMEDNREYLGDWYDNTDLTELLMGVMDQPAARRKMLLDHLLARFSERFSEYAFVMKKRYGDAAETQVLASQSYFLREYGAISYETGNAFDYHRKRPEQLWDSPNVSGFEKRISLLAGFGSYLRRHLSSSFVQLYRFTSSRNEQVYRWRMLERNRSIILSATENYRSTSQAYEEIYLVMQLVLQMTTDQIENHFLQTEEAGYETEDVGCFRITKSPSGRYSFSIINPAIQRPRDSRRIIASQYRYYSKQNIKNAILRFMAFISENSLDEGVFLVEHILLRPSFDAEADSPFLPFCAEDCQPDGVLDPYSFRVSVVLPGSSFRLADLVFRDYLENLIREELPSHILAKVCWIGASNPELPDDQNPLIIFENSFRTFLEHLGRGSKAANAAFIDVLSNLRSVYPEGSLFDCSVEDESGWEEKIILGRTNLGTL
ncbi:hypothetical protein ADIS_1421 [Lunatimonas lonarensis]|uniref:Uncharacterized protein n=1 Tax=Lunatimonas lonarensis TaxID=1232681 RepID=R7ZW52_9BACT|nr:hypothetical protein [Lunatimonas lonarensis]EON78224.1 hypothetical protein ADIS_1421 [Lunatimonas lonarensis]